MLRPLLGDMFSQQREMMRLTKKRGQIGCQRIDERLPLILIPAFQQRQIILEIIHSVHPQAARQATIHHMLLGWLERYAGILINQVANTFEIFLGEYKLAIMPIDRRKVMTHGIPNGLQKNNPAANCGASAKEIFLSASTKGLKPDPGRLKLTSRNFDLFILSQLPYQGICAV